MGIAWLNISIWRFEIFYIKFMYNIIMEKYINFREDGKKTRFELNCLKASDTVISAYTGNV